MARSTRAAELGLVAVTIEGGLIAPDQVQKIVATDRTAKAADSYACPKGTSLGEEISRYFRIGQHIWKDYDRIETPTVSQTARFAQTLLSQCFGFTDLAGPVEHQDGTRRYRLAWEAKEGRVPVVVAAPVAGADAFNKAQPEFGDGEGGRPRRSPVSLLQDWLNAAEHALWGLIFAGDHVRLMRDNASLTRPAWIEADLGAMFRDDMFADFTAWWLLVHATRFGAAGAPHSESPLEQWREEGMKQGIQARADLRRNVEEALCELGQGLVEANPDLTDRIRSGALPLQSLFAELLRTAYRLIFLAVAEDRDLLHPRRTTQAARSLYAQSYSFTFWRERSRRRVARDGHYDVWEAVKVTLASLEHGEDLLGLPALGGLFTKSATPTLNDALIPNRRFLAAVFCLGFIRKEGITHRINWRDLKTEELGSVYESLLEIRPRLEANGVFTLDSRAKGNDRKTTGSYYTPDSLVETLLDSALNPVLDRAEFNSETLQGKIAAILDLRIIDPACGSGHFLLGAARRMAGRVAKLRDEDAGKEETQAALRDVVSRCIHGVDRNPMAVELAKVALWIESVSPGQPLGFLDANIRCGDALLGVLDLTALEEGIPDDAYKPLTGDDKETAIGLRKQNKRERDGGLLKLAFDPGKISGDFRKFHRMSENTPREVVARAVEFERIRHTPDWLALRRACDIYVAAYLLPKPKLADKLSTPLVPTTAHLRKTISGDTTLGGGIIQQELGAAIDSAANGASAFHWPLEFPDVLIGRGGFDVVLGNPPWEVVQLGEQEYFASRIPEIAGMKGAARKKAIASLEQSHPELFADFARDKRTFDAMNDFARASGRFELTARGKINTYGLFAEHFLKLTRDGGRAGGIVPTGIATDATTAPFFASLVSNRRLGAILSFENEEMIFPGIHHAMKFCLLVCKEPSSSLAEFVFFARQVTHLDDDRRVNALTPDEIAQVNPNTKTAPIYRSRYDAELTAKIYNRVPVLIEEGKEGGNPWGVEFRQGLFNMTTDSRLFRTATRLTEEGFRPEGMDWVREVTETEDATIRRQLQKDLLAKAESERRDLLSGLGFVTDESVQPSAVTSTEHTERYVPLYEAKLIHQFDHRWATYAGPESTDVSLSEKQNPTFEVTPRYWVPQREVESRLNAKNWTKKWSFVYRRLATTTNERSGIGICMPIGGYGDSIFIPFMEKFDARHHAAFQGNFTSLTFDYVLRNKLGGLNLGLFALAQLAVLPPTAYSANDLDFIVPRVLELSYTSHSMSPFARDLGYDGSPFDWDQDRRAQLRAELDAWYALAYGLTRDELRYVLDPKAVMGDDYPSETFRVLQNNEMERFGEYRTQRLVLAAYDELTDKGMRRRVEGYR